MEDVAKISGLSEIERKSLAHMENMRAAAFEAVRKMVKPYDELNLIIAHLSGGITMSVHNKGRMVDIRKIKMDFFFKPKSIAVIGASPDPWKGGCSIIKNKKIIADPILLVLEKSKQLVCEKP